MTPDTTAREKLRALLDRQREAVERGDPIAAWWAVHILAALQDGEAGDVAVPGWLFAYLARCAGGLCEIAALATDTPRPAITPQQARERIPAALGYTGARGRSAFEDEKRRKREASIDAALRIGTVGLVEIAIGGRDESTVRRHRRAARKRAGI